MTRYPLRTRLLHWLTALLVFAMLFIGFVMVNSLNSYAVLRSIHMTLGVTVLVIVVVRAANRVTHRAPKLPDTVGWLEHKLVVGSELVMYGLLLAQPLVGWAVVSAAAHPVVIFGALRLSWWLLYATALLLVVLWPIAWLTTRGTCRPRRAPSRETT